MLAVVPAAAAVDEDDDAVVVVVSRKRNRWDAISEQKEQHSTVQVINRMTDEAMPRLGRRDATPS
jgi:hypothetical protein